MAIYQTELKRTHFLDKIKEHPVLFLTALFIFILGTASGYSSCSISYRGAVLTKTALLMEYGVNYDVFAGLIRTVMAYTLFYALISLVCIHRLFCPIAFLTLLFYGFLTGFTAFSFFYEFEWWGILYQAFFIVPNIMAATAMLLCLLRGWGTQKNTAQKIKFKGNLIESGEKKSSATSFGREIMLLFLAIGIEGVVIPLTLRILLY